MRHGVWAAFGLVAWSVGGAPAHAGVGVCGEVSRGFWHVDFQSYPDGGFPFEGDTVTTQFQASAGVVFGSIVGGDPLPRIVAAGGTAIAFNSSSGADKPLTYGTHALTPGLADDEVAGVFMAFDPPVERLKFYLVDVDASETVEVVAYGGGATIGTLEVQAGDPFTGDGVSTPVLFEGGGIDRVEVSRVPSTVTSGVTGFAIDSISFTRPLDVGDGRVVRVSQERAPGEGDFDNNVVTVMRPWVAGTVPVSEFYLYRNSFFGGAIETTANRSHLMLADLAEGMSLVMAHDKRSDGTGGQAETRVELSGDPDGAERTVQDEPQPLTTDPDVYTGLSGESVFTERHGWATFDGDGQAISGIDGPWTALVQFAEVDGNAGTSPIDRLDSWACYSSTGESSLLAIELGRRVELHVLGNCEAAAWPSRIDVCPVDTAVASATLGTRGSETYQWQARSLGTAGWVDVHEGLNAGVGMVSGEACAALSVSGFLSRSIELRAVVQTPCGSATTNIITVTVCPPDLSCDGVVNLDDIATFAQAFIAGDLLADLDGNGVLNLDDIAAFADAFLAGCP
ncbi:MAG: GC-type dockerin domain-anchored protein [Phycisphaerales bacterium]